MEEVSVNDSGLILGDPLSVPADNQDELSSAPDQGSAAAFQPPLPAAPPPLPSLSSDADCAQSAEELKKRREAVRAANAQRNQAMEGQKEVEDKVITALQTRSSAALQGAKDLLSFVKWNAELADQSQKNCARYAGLFANETGSTLATTSAFKANAESMQKQYQELHQQLTTVQLKKAEDSVSSTEETCRRILTQTAAMKTDLLNARSKLHSSFHAQERAWEEANGALGRSEKRLASVDLDPWLAGLKYQAAAKALETVDANYSSSLRRLVQDLREVELKRGEVLKSVLQDYADATKGLMERGVEGAAAFSALVGSTDASADCAAFLREASVKDEDLVGRVGEEERPSEATSTLGVWIPDDAVRQCNRCQSPFNLLRRKHHCRRCGHVFCDTCSQKAALLPASFGFGRKPQRVCETCCEILATSEDGAQQADISKTGVEFEVVREGALLKKGGIGALKPRHFVCTRAGFLHWFDSKFDSAPLGSVLLFGSRLSTVDDDACAIAIDAGEEGTGAAAFWKNTVAKGASGRGKHVLRSPIGSIDRDNWISVLKDYCTMAPDVGTAK